MRLFLAIEIPAALREALSRLQERLKSDWLGWRWVRPEGIHLTLRFLGEVDAGLDAGCREAWRAAAAAVRPFDIRLGRLGRFPRGGAPRVLWVGIDEVGEGAMLQALAGRVERAARSAGFKEEKRPFRAHLTLARARDGERARWSEGIAVERTEALRVDQLVLFRSQLLPAGARYTALDRFGLEGGDE